MRSLICWASTALCAILLVVLNGCATSRETRFYVLTPVSPVEKPKDVPAGLPPAIGLRPVELPEQLDRPQIVTRVGENMVHLAEFDQWAASLRDNVTRVLAANLAILVPTDRVAVFPWTMDGSIGFEVTVEVSRLEGTLGGNCSLAAHWAVFRRGGKDPIVMGNASYTEPAGAEYATLVAAESRLVAALAREIAAAVHAPARSGP